MEIKCHATRSRGIRDNASVSWNGIGKVPVAVRKLMSKEEWNFKPSGCRLPVPEESSRRKERIPTIEKPNCDVESPSLPVDAGSGEPFSRYIGETKSLRDLFLEAAVCGSCRKGKLDVTFITKCVATFIHTRCRNCQAHSASCASTTTIPQSNQPNQDRNTNYASNVLFVLAQLLSGNGGTESSRIVGMLDLPNPSIGKTAFPSIEYEIGKFIIPLAKEIIRGNLVREVGLYAVGNASFDFSSWISNHGSKPFLVDIEQLPKLTIGYDMGWQKRSSGHRYDSHSGHAIPVGVLTNLPVGLAILNRFCRVCASKDTNSKEATTADEVDHDCVANFDGSSGSMESAALVELAHDLLDFDHVLFGTIVADDDSSMRAQMKWSNTDWMINNCTTEPPRVLTRGGKRTIRPDKGQLRREYPEPKWLNDPSHRGKTLGGDLRSIEKQPKSVSKGINKIDCIKLHRNFGYMVKQLKEAPQDEWEHRGKAVLEHHFENHEFCGLWCKRKTKEASELAEDRTKPGRYYHCKHRDVSEYELLKAIVDKYITPERLSEVAHGYSTQRNESLNNNVSWLAQKNKSLSGSQSLSVRVHLAVGITISGYKPFIQELLGRMGVELSEGTARHLDKLWREKQSKSSLRKQADYKNKRNEKKREKLEEEIKGAEKKRRATGWYKPGEGFNECLPLVDPKVKLCRAGCGGSDHLTSQSKKCPMNLQNKLAAAQSKKSTQEEEITSLKLRVQQLETLFSQKKHD
jgi:hypothetical protein